MGRILNDITTMSGDSSDTQEYGQLTARQWSESGINNNLGDISRLLRRLPNDTRRQGRISYVESPRYVSRGLDAMEATGNYTATSHFDSGVQPPFSPTHPFERSALPVKPLGHSVVPSLANKAQPQGKQEALSKPKCRRLIIAGPPAGGKGSLAEELLKKYPGIKHLSTGDMLRAG